MNELKKYLENVYEELQENENDLDYLTKMISEDLLDYNLTFNSQKQLVDYKLYITLGGPNVWITKDCLKGTWGTQKEEIYIHESLSDKIFDLVTTYFVI